MEYCLSYIYLKIADLLCTAPHFFGLSNTGIAKELSISVKTVETHRANIMKKLEIHNLVDLVKFSMRNGIA